LHEQKFHSLAIDHHTFEKEETRAARYLRYSLSWVVLYVDASRPP
jgi:hypothetical protein